MRRSILLKTPRFEVIHEERLEGHFYFVQKPDAVLAILICNEKVALLRTTRVNVEGESWELPGGRIESGESPLDAAQREVWEEASISIERDRFSLMCKVSPLPSVTTEVVHVYRAQINESAIRPNALAIPHEGISEIALFDKESIFAMIRDGRIRSAIDGYAVLRAMLEKRNNAV